MLVGSSPTAASIEGARMTCYHKSGSCINHGACNRDDHCGYAPADPIKDMIEKAQERRVVESEHSERAERLARKLYETLVPEEIYKLMYERDKPAWRIEGLEWDRHPELEIAEHQRDDYRNQAYLLLEDPEIKIDI